MVSAARREVTYSSARVDALKVRAAALADELAAVERELAEAFEVDARARATVAAAVKARQQAAARLAAAEGPDDGGSVAGTATF